MTLHTAKWFALVGAILVLFDRCPDLRVWLADAVVRMLAQPMTFAGLSPHVGATSR